MLGRSPSAFICSMTKIHSSSMHQELAEVCRADLSAWDAQLGLIASEDIKVGEVIVAESPLFSVPDAPARHGSYAWDLVEQLFVSSRLQETFFGLRLKATEFLMDKSDVQLERDFAKRFKVERNFVRRAYFLVSTNNIAYFDDAGQAIGHGIFPILSRSNHSCVPSADLVPGDASKKQARLVAIKDIRAGEPVTWDYSDSAEFAEADYETRNFSLMNYMRFVCHCPRCLAEIPDELKQEKNLERYFDKLIAEEARSLAAEGVRR